MNGSQTAIDLVCWDFGDTLVDERFMRICPPGVPGWTEVYDRLLAGRPGWDNEWMLGRASLNELIAPLAEELSMERAAVSRHLRSVWQQIVWFPEVRGWVERLDGVVQQAVVTVNPWEFEGIAVACGLVPLVDVIVTSAELETLSKVTMAHRARELLGLPAGLATTLLIDNKRVNVDEFVAAGGRGWHFVRETFDADAAAMLAPLLGSA